MRNNCIGLVDLLCAYADGELPESDIKVVEDHLIICENCSAILKIYKEIPSAVIDTNVPAPDALCIGVMNRIQSESVPTKIIREKKWWHRKVILTRYAPIAACLVIGLLVWGIWGDFRALMPGSNAAPESTEAAPFAAMSNQSMPDVENDSSLDTGGVIFDDFDDDDDVMMPESVDDAVARRTDAGGQGLQIGNPIEQVFSEQLITLTIEEESLSPTGGSFIVTNDSDESIEFAEKYSVQILIDGIWHDIIKREGGASTDILFICEPGNEVSFGVDWSYFYGNLPEGTFRLVKSITYSDIVKPDLYIAGEFIIR